MRDISSEDPGADGAYRRMIELRSLPRIVRGAEFEECLFVGPGCASVGPGSSFSRTVGFALDRAHREATEQIGRAVLTHPRVDLLEGIDVTFDDCGFSSCGFSGVLLFVPRDRLQEVVGSLADRSVPTSLLDPRLPRSAGAPLPDLPIPAASDRLTT